MHLNKAQAFMLSQAAQSIKWSPSQFIRLGCKVPDKAEFEVVIHKFQQNITELTDELDYRIAYVIMYYYGQRENRLRNFLNTFLGLTGISVELLSKQAHTTMRESVANRLVELAEAERYVQFGQRLKYFHQSFA